MDTKLKSKVARVADEFASIDVPQFPRDRAGLSFKLRETNTMFILTAHLKGCTRGNVKTDIIEDGTKVVVTCEKPVQETVTIESKVIKKGVKIRKFTESFKIPDGVMVDEIKTDFNEETSKLTITMPKRIKKAELVTQSSSENLPSAADKILKKDKGEEFLADSESAYRKRQVEKYGKETEKPNAEPQRQNTEDMNQETNLNDEVPGKETEKPKAEPECQNTEDRNQETNLKDDQVCEKANGIQEEECQKAKGKETEKPKAEPECQNTEDMNQETNFQYMNQETNLTDEVAGKETEKPKAEPKSQNTEDMNQETNLKNDQVCEKTNGIQEEEDKLPRRSNICVPVIVGSTIILSLVVFVIHFMRKKKQPGKRKE